MNPTQVGAIEIGVFVMCLAAIAALVVNLLKIRALTAAKERQPPLDQELYAEFARKRDLDRMSDERKVEISQLRSEMSQQLTALDARHQKTAGEIFNVMRKVSDDLRAQLLHFEGSLNGVAEKIGEMRGELKGHIAADKGGDR